MNRPIIKKGSSNPVFRGGGSKTINCATCGQLLVESIDLEAVLDVDIECQCGTVATLPSWAHAEPLPSRAIALPMGAKFLIEGPVQLDSPHGVFASAVEIQRIRDLYGCRSRASDKLELSPAKLEETIASIDLLTSGNLSEAIRRTQRAFQSGNETFLQFPLAWAFIRLKRSLRNRVLDFSGDDAVAANYFQLIDHLIGRWGHHPVFQASANGLIYEFYHATAMLIAAAYLADAGNSISFTDTAAEAGRSPDLFIPLARNYRVALEVKAPEQLQWPQEVVSTSRIEEAIRRVAKSAKGQIPDGQPGFLVIGISCSVPEEQISKAMESLHTRGRIPPNIAATTPVLLQPNAFLRAEGDRRLLESTARVLFFDNPRYAGEKNWSDGSSVGAAGGGSTPAGT